jgi:hypothetical protein
MVSVKDQAVDGLRRRAGRGLGFDVNVSRWARSLYLCVHSWLGK